MTDNNTDEMRHIIEDAKPMQTPIDVRLRRADQFANAVWWIMFLVCLGVAIYGFVAL